MFEWLFGKSYTEEDIEKLLKLIKTFNAGAVDDPLSRHIDKVYEMWKSDR